MHLDKNFFPVIPFPQYFPEGIGVFGNFWQLSSPGSLGCSKREKGKSYETGGSNNLPNPTVSIVTPPSTRADFIRETIESVLSQDYRSIEYMVCDGGSADETLDILKHTRSENLLALLDQEQEVTN